jgi:hypothetical protein
MNTPKFLTKREFCNILCISLTSLDRGIKSNEWPFSNYVRIGKRILYPYSLIAEIEASANKKKPKKEGEDEGKGQYSKPKRVK